MILTPTYHVFEMYKVHQDATYLPVSVETPPYRFDDVSMPAVNPVPFTDAKLAQGILRLNVPARSVAVLELR